MKKFWIVIVLAAVAISLGCGGGGGAEAAAKKMLQAMKDGDVDTFLNYLDFKGQYDKMSEAERGGMDYEAFEKMTKGFMSAALEADKEKAAKIEFKVLGSEVKDDVTMVKVKKRDNAEAEWEEDEIPYKKVDGKWKTDLGSMN